MLMPVPEVCGGPREASALCLHFPQSALVCPLLFPTFAKAVEAEKDARGRAESAPGPRRRAHSCSTLKAGSSVGRLLAGPVLRLSPRPAMRGPAFPGQDEPRR